jgi:hypothetical protein
MYTEQLYIEQLSPREIALKQLSPEQMSTKHQSNFPQTPIISNYHLSTKENSTKALKQIAIITQAKGKYHSSTIQKREIAPTYIQKSK